MKRISILLLSIFIFANCASTLNSQYQKIAIKTKKGNNIYIDGEKAKKKDGYYLVKRDFNPKQITSKREGYKDENIAIGQYKRHWLYAVSWVPFGLLMMMPPLLDMGPKAYNYEKQLTIGKNMKAFPVRDENAKEIYFSKVGIELEADKNRYRGFLNYRDYKNHEDSKESIGNKDTEVFKINNTIFSESLNEILKENGYIDTTNKVLKNSFLNNLKVEANIEEYTLHHVNQRVGGFYYVDITMDYTILDYYGDSIFGQSTKSTSGHFSYLKNTSKIRGEKVDEAIKDALEFSMIEFLDNTVVDSLMHDKGDLDRENKFEMMPLVSNGNYVSSLKQAIKSTVTIKTKDGHGSGFIVSPDGYIITNYHVISDTAKLNVVLNDEREFKPTIIRISKIHDLALIKIKAENLVPFNISNSKDIEVAEDIYAVGTPSGEDLSQSITKGIISGVRNIENGSQLIQTDASINGGNSGGVIIDKNATVIGVVSSKLKGFSIEGVAFGIPAYEINDKLKVTNKAPEIPSSTL
ncbi:MAG: serine protease Do [Flavobacteriales bacterium]|jgi:serine protease Do